jgi:hypothetical protein
MGPTIINGKKYYWTPPATKKQVADCLRLWQGFCFRYNEKDYAIERHNDGIVIRDPQVDHAGCVRKEKATSYPESRKAKTPEEFLSLPFLDGKTIFEQFEQLRFFATYREKTVVDDMMPEILEEFIENYTPFFFTFRGQDYLVEGFCDLGYVIVEPKLYYSEGAYPEKTNAAYPGYLEAKMPDEFKALPFLDGKTIFERFGELQFFDM